MSDVDVISPAATKFNGMTKQEAAATHAIGPHTEDRDRILLALLECMYY